MGKAIFPASTGKGTASTVLATINKNANRGSFKKNDGLHSYSHKPKSTPAPSEPPLVGTPDMEYNPSGVTKY